MRLIKYFVDATTKNYLQNSRRNKSWRQEHLKTIRKEVESNQKDFLWQ